LRAAKRMPFPIVSASPSPSLSSTRTGMILARKWPVGATPLFVFSAIVPETECRGRARRPGGCRCRRSRSRGRTGWRVKSGERAEAPAVLVRPPRSRSTATTTPFHQVGPRGSGSAGRRARWRRCQGGSSTASTASRCRPGRVVERELLRGMRDVVRDGPIDAAACAQAPGGPPHRVRPRHADHPRAGGVVDQHLAGDVGGGAGRRAPRSNEREEKTRRTGR
jgi:hypothetical protein